MTDLKAGLAERMPPPEWLTPKSGPAAGMRLAFRAYPAAKKPRAHVLISHGFSEHSGWWQHVALAFQAAGYSAYLFDHYSHGESAGRVADIPHYDVLAAGLKLALEEGVLPRAQAKGTNAPVVLLAHSNGCLTALWAMADIAKHLRLVVLCSPLIQMPFVSKWFGMLPAWTLSRFDPGSYWHIPLRPQRLSSDASLWKTYLSDPLRFHKISARFYLAMRAASNVAVHLTDLRGLPLLMLTADHDQVVDRAAMLSWYERAVSPDKTRLGHPAREHELFNEVDWHHTFEEVLSWLDARLPKA